MAPTDPSSEVRRCAKCGQPTLVVTRTWHHRFVGIFTGARTFELGCTSCGAQVVLHPQREIALERLFAMVMMPAIVPGLFFLARARKKARAWAENPVVEGAAPVAPASLGVPHRQCECLAIASCVALVRQGRWDFVLGTAALYECRACSRRFVVHDLRGVVFAALFGVALVAAGTFVILHPPGSAVAAERSNQWFGAGAVGFGVIAFVVFALRVWKRVVHPIA